MSLAKFIQSILWKFNRISPSAIAITFSLMASIPLSCVIAEEGNIQCEHPWTPERHGGMWWCCRTFAEGDELRCKTPGPIMPHQPCSKVDQLTSRLRYVVIYEDCDGMNCDGSSKSLRASKHRLDTRIFKCVSFDKKKASWMGYCTKSRHFGTECANPVVSCEAEICGYTVPFEVIGAELIELSPRFHDGCKGKELNRTDSVEDISGIDGEVLVDRLRYQMLEEVALQEALSEHNSVEASPFEFMIDIIEREADFCSAEDLP